MNEDRESEKEITITFTPEWEALLREFFGPPTKFELAWQAFWWPIARVLHIPQFLEWLDKKLK